ncbi:penicillin acylase family protein [Pseudomonas sp. HR96]|uniref:penicillin acylase family protein n=1 Tax=Pseudomonas sp. HR96 TaxID=1027966 RepID=UPI002A762F67|nr:penicillin acylase family protein [Pseudomonas sp. HR96]WPO99022.1 penicillin acylase family protein [Pseudomonas sp. HR96]
MASPAPNPTAPRLRRAAALVALLGLAGCQTDGRDADSLPPTTGVQPLKGLAQNVSVRRNSLGMPLIESSTFHDALFAQGYVNASDRIEQMVRMRLLAQGRLAEMLGPDALDVDRLMRSINLKRSADQLYEASSPRLKRFFEVYARGVNAYLFRYRDNLPKDLADSGYRPEYWKPEDSALVFSLLSFNLSVNLREEISALVLAQKVGADKLAWLLPTYPDEPLPQGEADKLKGISLASQLPGLSKLDDTSAQLSALSLTGSGNASNWAIAPQQARAGQSLLAADMQLPTRLPGLWNTLQIRAPKYQVAGLSLAGIPGVLSGFNGKLAWSLSAVRGDNQDLYLEKLKSEGNRLMYQVNGQWQPLAAHNETYFIKGQRPVREIVYETRHGPLLDLAVNGVRAGQTGYALALQLPDGKDDKSLDALFDLSRAQSMEQASDASREVHALAANIVFADAGNVGWQVTGRYPNRRDGLGLVPSPGWENQYDWDGYADPMLFPYDQNPTQGWVGTANQRTVPHGYGMQLSNSWAAPERAERLAQLASASKQDSRSSIAMQYDQTTLFAAKLKKMFEAPGMAQPLKQAIERLPEADRAKAREAYSRLLAFDGRLTPTSADAAVYELFLQQSARQIFLDELGPQDSPSWKAFVANAGLSWSAQADHLLGREDSPFWDDVGTAQKEDKPAILARSLAAAMTAGDAQLGADHKAWQWGRLHTYNWLALDGKPLRPAIEAGGDQSTLNGAGYAWGSDFTVNSASSLRMIVDFAQNEPMMVQNAGGQSGNPASPNHADGIDPWLKAQYVPIPLQLQNYERAYGVKRLTLVPAK